MMGVAEEKVQVKRRPAVLNQILAQGNDARTGVENKTAAPGMDFNARCMAAEPESFGRRGGIAPSHPPEAHLKLSARALHFSG
jgi:hypothetical protein